ncbi:MAG: hypothetical protein NZ739_10550, partial [Verrucomicrobiae bacterium]|nr:hypothetical protein [Verrucomicrobiae bacterium]
LAPTDMLLQRLGRLWRHERATRPCEHPEVWIQLPPLTEAQLRGASAEELRQGLGKSARVYAPYVLLRSLQQWRARTSITIPTEIRAILEATYAEPAETEPPAWCEFREHLEDQKSEMEKLALSATKVWSMPALKDEEGVQTRYNPYEMAQLLLVHQVGERADHTFLVKLLNGVEVAVTDRDWDFNAARAIYLNITPVPFWTVSRLVAGQPAWLTNYAQMRTAVAQVLPDGRIRSVDGRADLCLSYHPDEGVKIHYDRIQQRPRKDDEYFD